MLTSQTLQEFLHDDLKGSLALFANIKNEAIHVSGVSIPEAAIMVASRFFQEPSSIIIIAKDYKSGEIWLENLQSLVGEEFVAFFPSLGLKPYEQKIPFEGVLEERIKFFKETWNTQKPLIAIAPLDAFLMKLPSPEILKKQIKTIKVGDILEPSTLRPWFLDRGFVEQPVVSSVGEFSIRACIVDVNSLLYPHPIRIEFYGDEVESIRTFDIFTQRSIENLKSIDLYPMGEFSVSAKELFELGNEAASIWWKRAQYENLDFSLLDYLPHSALVFEELSLLLERATSLYASYERTFDELKTSQISLEHPSKLWWKIGELSRQFVGKPSLDITRTESNSKSWYHIQSKVQEFSTSGGADAVAKEIEEFTATGGRIYVVAPTPGALTRLQHVFEGLEIEGYFVGNLTEGFWLLEDKIAFLTETRIFNRQAVKNRKRKIASSVASALMVESLNRGDYVSHEDHGVGRYLGLVRVEVNGGMVDCALLEYEGGDRLKFPVADLHKIDRLQISDESKPKLDKLGGKAWENLKARVKKKVVQIAKELVELYAKRELVEGFMFPSDTPLQREFEEAFEFEPTPDQEHAFADIKRDMESAKPMDRLICGDVGFGKTEVAMRAAFKCISAKKQVAILVPTTILAAQHYENFKDRFAAFPVNVALVNRYKTAKEKREIFKEVGEGRVDILVGTHALLSEKNQFKDLGLLIIDEEQKFGVKQKEKLREFRLTVDTLSMSATPIPRSLHLSMTGVRDISLINTPPVNRLPVETKLLKRDDILLAEALKDELERGGQVFIVNDRVHNINQLAEEVEGWAPEARVAVAHGQMEDRELERVMNAFLRKEFDVLVSTSIIESGLNIPSANTIIIMNAHHFGISQLYQMRGRVGRSSVLAKAFLVIPPHNEISNESMRRLKALEQYTDLGSGYQLAMRDLEIRGAGNLLGQEQHGFIAEVGFETYVRLVREAVEMLRGTSKEKPIQPRVEIGVDAYLPEDYIEDGLTRISIYQRLARVGSSDEIENLKRELEDRFGKIPTAAQMLLHVTELSLLAGRMRIQGVQQKKGLLVATFSEYPNPDPMRLLGYGSVSPYPIRFTNATPVQAVIELGQGSPEKLAERALECFRAFQNMQ